MPNTTADAARLREILTRQTIDLISQYRPSWRYGSVTSIDPPSQTVQVKFPENTGSTTVRYGSIRPSEVGQQVRVGIIDGDLFVSDVLGYVIYTGIEESAVLTVNLDDVILGLGSLIPTWSSSLGYPEYMIEYAEDVNFTVGVGSQITNQRETEVIPNLDSATQYWVRLRAGSGDGFFGVAGAAVGPRTPLAAISTDGLAPASSPQPVIDNGIKSLFVNWVPLVNPDLVTYEVYVDIVSGFTPGPLNFYGETTGTHYSISTLADASPLPVDGSNVYVRLIAKDDDGAASAGAQGVGIPQLVELGDIGNIPYSAISDGIAPPSSPNVLIQNGPGYLIANWDHGVNADQLTYEVHISTVPGFIPAANTKVSETNSNFAWIRSQALADGGGALNYATNYYIRIVATDLDGVAPYGNISIPVTVPQVNTADVTPFAITNALIANLSVDNAKIVDASITQAKIGNLAVNTAQIANAAITSAKISNLAVGNAQISTAAITDAKIANATITNAKIANLNVSKLQSGTITAAEIILSGISSSIRSSNFVNNTSGWRILGNGTAEFNAAIYSGQIDIGGSDATSFHVNVGGQMWLGSGSYTSAPFRVNNDGSTVMNNLTVNGTLLSTGSTHNYTSNNTVIYGGTTNVQSGNYSFGTTGWRISSDGVARFNGGLFVGGGAAITGLNGASMVVDGDSTAMNANTFRVGDNIVMKGSLANPAIRARAGQHFRIQTPDGLNTVFEARSTGEAACFISNTSGALSVNVSATNGVQILRAQTSSLRWKTDVSYLDVDDSMRVVRQLRPIQFKSKHEHERNEDFFWSFAAEEAAAVHHRLAVFDDKGLPLGLNQLSLIASLWGAVKNLDDRLNRLTPG